MQWVPWILSGFGVLIALISLARTFLVAGRDASAKLQKDMAHTEERLALIEMKLGIFWRLVEENLSGMLKKPTHTEMDMLLDKLRTHTISLDECYRLRRWLHQAYLQPAADPENDPDSPKRIIAILVTGAVESLIKELERV